MTFRDEMKEKLNALAAKAETAEQWAKISFLEAAMNGGPFWCPQCGVQTHEATR